MSAFGKAVELTYVNDSTTVPISAANKNEEQRLLTLMDGELSRSKEYNFGRMKNYYYQHNCKLIDDFDDATDWSAGASTTVSDDTTHYNLNFSAVKFLENDSTASYIGMTKSISSMDLTEFANGDSSDSDDFIFIVFYISDYTKFTSLTFKLGTDNSHNYAIDYLPSAQFTRSGYYCLYAKKSDFTDNSGPGWDDITWLYCEAYTASGAQNEYITMQALQLVRKDPDDSDKCNPFQSYRNDLSAYVADIEFPYEPWGLFYDKAVEELIMYEVEQYDFTGNQFGVLLREDLIEFCIKAKVYPKEDDSGILSFTWRVNDENYLEAYIQSDTMYIRKRESGSTTYTSVALNNALSENRILDVIVEKQGQNMLFIVTGNGNNKSLITSTSISASSEGDLYLGHYSTHQFSTLPDFTLSHNPNCRIAEDKQIIIKNNTQDSSVTSASFENSSDVWSYLKPNRLYEIELHLVYHCASTAVEAKFQWDTSGVTLVGGINTMCMAVSSTNAGKAEYSKWESYDDFLTDILAGTETGPCYGRISFLVRTEIDEDGYIRLQFAQRNTDAGNPLYLDTDTYMKITPVRIVGT